MYDIFLRSCLCGICVCGSHPSHIGVICHQPDLRQFTECLSGQRVRFWCQLGRFTHRASRVGLMISILTNVNHAVLLYISILRFCRIVTVLHRKEDTLPSSVVSPPAELPSKDGKQRY